MKLLVDIPDDRYEEFKAYGGPKTYAEHLITDGIPIPDCALADADAIIEDLRSMRDDYEYGDEYDNGTYRGLDVSIDTVEKHII